MFKKTLINQPQNHQVSQLNSNEKHKSTLRQMMALTNQQNLVQNLAYEQSKDKSKKPIGATSSSSRKRDAFFQARNNENVYTLRMKQNKPNQLKSFGSDCKKKHPLLQVPSKSASKNSFNNFSEDNLYQILDQHIQGKSDQFEVVDQYYNEQERQDSQEHIRDCDYDYQFGQQQVKRAQKRIPLLSVHNNQSSNSKLDRKALSPFLIKKRDKWEESREINLSPLRRPSHKNQYQNKAPIRKEEHLPSVFDSKELTFKALQKNPTKKFRFSQLARQFVKNQNQVENQYYEDGFDGQSYQRIPYGNNQYYRQDERNTSQKSSFNKTNFKSDKDKEAKVSNGRVKTPTKNIPRHVGYKDQYSLHIQKDCKEEMQYEYQFPETYSPSRSRKGTPNKSRVNQQSTSHSKDKMKKINAQVSSTLEQSLRNFQIPSEYKNQITKGEYERLNKEFQRLKHLIIVKIEEQILKGNGKNSANKGSKFSVEGLVETLNETISRTFQTYGNAQNGRNNKETLMLKQSIRDSIRYLTRKHQQRQIQNPLKQDDTYINGEKNPNLFSFQGGNQFILSQEQLRTQQQIENENLQENPFKVESQSNAEDQQNQVLQNGKQLKLQRNASQKLEQELPIIGFNFDSDSSLSSMGIPALIQSLQVPQNLSVVKSNGFFLGKNEQNSSANSNLNSNSYFKRIPMVTSLNKMSLANTIKNQFDLESVEECPNNENQNENQVKGVSRQSQPSSLFQNPNKVIVSVQPFGIGISAKNSGQDLSPIPLKQENKYSQSQPYPQQQSQLTKLAFTKKQFKPYLQNRILKKKQAKQVKEVQEGKQKQDKRSQFYEVRYNLKYLDKKSDHTEVVRVSPMKMRKNQQIMQNLVMKKIIKKESNSIIYE